MTSSGKATVNVVQVMPHIEQPAQTPQTMTRINQEQRHTEQVMPHIANAMHKVK